MVTKDAEVDVKEITVWALRIFVTNSKCRKVRLSSFMMQTVHKLLVLLAVTKDIKPHEA